MRNKLLFSVIATWLTLSVSAQQEQKVSFQGYEGQLALTTDLKGAFFNLGGPNLKFIFPKFSVGISFMPSLRFQEVKGKSFVTPTLGFGPQVYLAKQKRLVLTFPSYYNTSLNAWNFTAGVGYVITTKK